MNAPITVPDPPCSSVPPITAAEIAWNRITLAPDGSGVVVAARTASRIPTNPASAAHSTKLRVSTTLVRTPASDAPSRFPPTATV